MRRQFDDDHTIVRSETRDERIPLFASAHESMRREQRRPAATLTVVQTDATDLHGPVAARFGRHSSTRRADEKQRDDR